MPERRALPARWQVAALGVAPRIAEARGQEGDAAGIIEGVPVDPEPAAQAVAARVVERQPARMDLRAGSLADDQDACGRADPRHGPRAERQMRGAYPAAAQFLQGTGEDRVRRRRQWPACDARKFAACSRSEEHTSEPQSLMRLSFS